MVEPKAWFAGVDWASEAHHVCVVGGDGSKREERIFRHGGAGLAEMVEWIAAKSGGSAPDIPVAIEVPHGPVVESLMDRGFAVYAINPKQLDRFRDRFSPGRRQGRQPRRPCPRRRAEDRSSPLPEDRPRRPDRHRAQGMVEDRRGTHPGARSPVEPRAGAAVALLPADPRSGRKRGRALVPRPLGEGSDAREGPAGPAPDPREGAGSASARPAPGIGQGHGWASVRVTAIYRYQ